MIVVSLLYHCGYYYYCSTIVATLIALLWLLVALLCSTYVHCIVVTVLHDIVHVCGIVVHYYYILHYSIAIVLVLHHCTVTRYCYHCITVLLVACILYTLPFVLGVWGTFTPFCTLYVA